MENRSRDKQGAQPGKPNTHLHFTIPETRKHKCFNLRTFRPLFVRCSVQH